MTGRALFLAAFIWIRLLPAYQSSKWLSQQVQQTNRMVWLAMAIIKLNVCKKSICCKASFYLVSSPNMAQTLEQE
eukprot:5262973-Amphidinium_carterae.1